MKTSSFYHKYKEIILGLFMVALSGFYLYHSQFIKIRSTVRVDARLIPQILGVVVLFLGICQLVAGVKYLRAVRLADAENRTPSVFMSPEEKKDFMPIVLTFVLIIGYAVAFEPLGFVVASVLCMFFQMMILAPSGKRNPAAFFVISVVVALVVYVAFRKGLDLSLPQGLLEGLPI